MPRHMFKLLAVPTLACFAVAMAAAPPDLNGNWKANLAKSDFGPMPAPTSIATKIEQKEPSVKMTTTFVGEQGEMTFDLKVMADGSETTNNFGPVTLKSKAKWDGRTLVIDSKGSTDNGDVTTLDKWSLSEDGKTITVTSNFTGPQGEMVFKTVYEKQ
ncbi:MAG: hypothetical protein ACLQGV_12940 [Bryobacteraceae bacterium]